MNDKSQKTDCQWVCLDFLHVEFITCLYGCMIGIDNLSGIPTNQICSVCERLARFKFCNGINVFRQNINQLNNQ